MIQVERREDGGIRIVLRADLAEAMRTLPERLREVLERPDVSQRVAARLFPKAHDDPAEEAEYRRLVGTDLIKKSSPDSKRSRHPGSPQAPAVEIRQQRADSAT
jgi:hypothetical protein